ncbi:hypothetical protein W911_01905 [Hyphomicrobium nitrativorans NL23]|uniref:Uncharacterized protein n=1 Tax=Hyphomicrobium nitrativorans NL23 TaxID=1029756 RepID=V5SG55_9HYPH|nr:hypothetical protein W911_01905 [Hyphomicrobium nitrativorans NL23]
MALHVSGAFHVNPFVPVSVHQMFHVNPFFAIFQRETFHVNPFSITSSGASLPKS